MNHQDVGARRGKRSPQRRGNQRPRTLVTTIRRVLLNDATLKCVAQRGETTSKHCFGSRLTKRARTVPKPVRSGAKCIAVAKVGSSWTFEAPSVRVASLKQLELR